MKIWGNATAAIGTLIFFSLLPSLSAGAVFNVTTPAEFQAALDAAISNNQPDTINVAAGTYNLTGTLLYDHTGTVYDNNPLTITGAGAASTILDGTVISGYWHNVMMIDCTGDSYGHPYDNNCDITISGLTFQNGNEYNGAGLYFNAFDADLVVQNCVFSGNVANSDDGGGLYASTRGYVTLTGNTFTANTADSDGGGAYVGADAGALIQNNTFSGNYSTYGDGGGLFAEGALLTITGNTFTANTLESGYYGGAGFYGYASAPDVLSAIITDNTVAENVSTYGGAGGAYVYAKGSADISGNQFTENDGYYGGGIYVDAYQNQSVSLSDNLFHDNSAKEGGGAGIFTGGSSINLVNNVFSNNIADSYNGGGIYLYTGSLPATVVMTNNTLTRNTVSGSGGLYYGRGGGVFIRTSHNDCGVALHNNIIWGNSAVEEGGDLYINDDGNNDGIGSTVNLYYNDFSEVDIFDGDVLLQDGNIDSNPSFVDAVNNDVHLLGYSPCIEAGNNSAPLLPALDYEGDTRIINPIVDIGADEYDGEPISALTLTMAVAPAGAGTTDPPIGTTSVLPATPQAISATANGGYNFVNWTTSGSQAVVADPNSSSTTVTLTADGTVTANFCLVQTWYPDNDGDTYGNPGGAPLVQCGQPVGYVSDNTDCNDTDDAVHPGATELAGDEFDQNCDGQELCYLDADDDGYRPDATSTILSLDTDCVDPGEALSSDQDGDCNDADPAIHPEATEIVDDGIDQNCDSQELCYADADDDGYRPDATSTIPSADLDCDDQYEAHFSDPIGDCNDSAPAIHPGATEFPGDEVDQDCDGQELCYLDADDDGYRPNTTSTILSLDTDCVDPGEALSSDQDGDCDDTNADVHPGATEVCDGLDNNCNGSVDEGVILTWYRDSDGDGYGDPGDSAQACSQPEGYVADDTDCNDADALEHPGQTWYKDEDGDGYSDGTSLVACLRPLNYYVASELIRTSGDPDDTDPNIIPSRFPWTMFLPAIIGGAR